jgi:hypothetical protein
VSQPAPAPQTPLQGQPQEPVPSTAGVAGGEDASGGAGVGGELEKRMVGGQEVGSGLGGASCGQRHVEVRVGGSPASRTLESSQQDDYNGDTCPVSFELPSFKLFWDGGEVQTCDSAAKVFSLWLQDAWDGGEFRTCGSAAKVYSSWTAPRSPYAGAEVKFCDCAPHSESWPHA